MLDSIQRTSSRLLNGPTSLRLRQGAEREARPSISAGRVSEVQSSSGGFSAVEFHGLGRCFCCNRPRAATKTTRAFAIGVTGSRGALTRQRLFEFVIRRRR